MSRRCTRGNGERMEATRSSRHIHSELASVALTGYRHPIRAKVPATLLSKLYLSLG